MSASKGKLYKRLKKNPDKYFLIIYVISGHGFVHEGKQVLVVNQFNPRTKYYEFWHAERDIRDFS